MHHLLIMQITNTLNYLLKKFLCQLLSIVTLRLLCNLIKYFLTWDEIHHNVYFLRQLVKKVVSCLNDILMLQFTRNIVLLFVSHLLFFVWFASNFHCKWMFFVTVLSFIALVNSGMGSLSEYFRWIIIVIFRGK